VTYFQLDTQNPVIIVDICKIPSNKQTNKKKNGVTIFVPSFFSLFFFIDDC
jgi:hypothetical protein